MDGTLWQWILGLAVVIVYGAQRFDSPVHLRATTTFARYMAAKLFYVASVVFLFVLLAGVLTDPQSVILLLGGGTVPGDVTKETSSMPGPLLSALFLTALLPSLPVLKNIDLWMKMQFQQLGNIPFEIRQLSGRLNQSAFKVPASQQHELEEELAAWSNGDADIAATLSPNDIRARMTRLASMVLTVRKWKDEPRYGQYVEEHKNTEQEINRLYGGIKTALVGVWMAARKAGESAKNVVEVAERQLRDEITLLQKLLNDFISGGILQCERSKSSRAMSIRAVGFIDVEEGRAPLRVDQIAGMAIAIFLSMAAVALLCANWFGDADFGRTFGIIVMVSMIYVVAIIVAIYPKSVWREADIRALGHRPYAAYLATVVIAVVLAFFIALAFKYVFFFDLNFVASLEDSLKRWPWLVMSGGAAFVVAWAADDFAIDPKSAPKLIRVYEAVGVAAVFVLLQWFVQSLLVSEAGTVGEQLQHADRFPRRLLTAGMVGLVIGYGVPHMCRARFGGKEADSDPKAGLQTT